MRSLKLIIRASLAAAAALSLSGCATATAALYGEDKLAEITARHLGVEESSITIKDRQPTATGTYYNVVSKGKTMRCFQDGNVFGFGVLSNPPSCGNQLNSNPLASR